MRARLWLIGMMASGKSTVGAAAARRIGVDHHDTDAIIEARAGMAVSEIFETVGVAAYRDLERQAIEHAATLQGIISTGGGAVLDEQSRSIMADTGPVVYLAAEPATLRQRVSDIGSRPLLRSDPLDSLTTILENRESWYLETAHRVIDTTGMRRGEVVEEVIRVWNDS